MGNEPKLSPPSKTALEMPTNLKEWIEVIKLVGLCLLLPGIMVLWGYAYFDLGFIPSGLSEWFPILYASLNLTVTLIICLALTILVGRGVATIVHGGFIPSRNKRGVPGFRLNGLVDYLGFWNIFALMAIPIVAWLFIESPQTSLWKKALILVLNLMIAYLSFRLWNWDAPVKENPSQGNIWNSTKPYLWKGLVIFSLMVSLAPLKHAIMHHFVERALVMSGVRSDWTRLRISDSHLESLKRKSQGKLDLATSKEGEQTFLYVDHGRVLFQRLGSDALLELRTSTGKAIRYRLPSSDFREIGYSDDEPASD